MKAGGIIYIGMWNLNRKLFGLFASLVLLVAAPASAQTDACGTKGVSLDHVIWAVPDLEDYVVRFEALTGIKPNYGGEHTNGTTANYLVALGPCTYLEIVGPKAGITPEMMGEDAAKYAYEHVAGFAFGADIDNPTDELKALDLGERREGGRIKPDGTSLSWVTSGLTGVDFGKDRFQFVIKWTSEPHPATTAAAGAEIRQFTIAYPDSVKLRELVENNNLPIVLQPSGRPNMWLTINTPRGSVILR